jgi:hypothetical protein
MRRMFIGGVIVLCAATAADAHDYSTDFLCSVVDATGNQIKYAFANNSANSNGSVGGTYVETGFSKNGRTITSPPGSRPIWIYGMDDAGRAWIYPRATPGWAMYILNPNTTNGQFIANAQLIRNWLKAKNPYFDLVQPP